MTYNVQSISEKLIECVTELLDYFSIKYTNTNKSISFACPIHGGDNPTGSSILKYGVGNWQCFTHQCHIQYGSSIINFLQALLSIHYDSNVNFSQALEWAANFVGETDLIPQEDTTRTSFIQLCKYINKEKEKHTQFTPRSLVRNFLTVPATYYIKRGYTPDILEKFDVGYCHNHNKPFYDRVITPFYDDNGEYMVGCSGRSRYEKCSICGFYHNPDTRCPLTKTEKLATVKWKHNSNFLANSYLYNYWNAKQHILNTNTVILVEGPGDVWKLEEAKIFNSLALLGAKLSYDQKIILEESGAMNIIVATDNDEAGEKAFRSINESCKRMFNIYRISMIEKDIGDTSIDNIKRIFTPILEKL